MIYRQCELIELYGSRQTVAWIEERAAHRGYHVELPALDAWFLVHEVYNGSIEATALRNKQAADRNAFASITA